MKYLERPLANEIRERYDFLQNQDRVNVFARCRNVIEKDIEREAHLNSYRLEHPELDLPYPDSHNTKRRITVDTKDKNGNKRKIKIKLKEGMKNLDSAFSWGRTNFDLKNLDEYFIREIAGKIAPEIYPDRYLADYRTSDASLKYTRYRVGYEDIKSEISELIEHLKDQEPSDDIIDWIESALYAQFNIERIQPFPDGNKRTARTFSDIILYEKGLPAPIIEAGERQIHLDLFLNALKGWTDLRANDKSNDVSEEEKLYFNYLGSKINTSLDKVIRWCS